jgi:PAS domain S-box-containing protein
MADAKILVVEDEIVLARNIKTRLQDLGYAVPAVASSAEEALQEAAETCPDLVLIDIKLKEDMDGVEAAEQIYDRLDIPVIYLTAYADDDMLQRAKITEPSGYILKSLEEGELRTTLEIVLYKHEMAMKLKESEQWLSIILKSIRDAVIVSDAKECIKVMNPIAEALTGWKRENALSKDLTEVLKIINEQPPAYTEKPVTRLLREGGCIRPGIHTLVTKDGVETAIDYNATPIRDDKGNITGVVSVFRDITAHLEMSELLESIVEWAAGLLRTYAAEIYLYDEGREELRLAIGYGSEFVGATVKPGEGMVGKVFQSGEPMIVDDYHTWEGRATVFETSPPFTTVLVVPLKWREWIIGGLAIVADSRGRTFNQDDVRLATLFANLAAVTIKNAQLYEELQNQMEEQRCILAQQVAERTAELARRALQLETSAQVSREITSILDIDELLTRVVELIREAFGYYYVQIFLVDTGTNHLVLQAGSGEIGRQFKSQGKSLEISTGSLNGEVAQTNEALMVNDLSQEPRYLAEELLPDTMSELVIPLRIGGQVIGTLDVQSTELNAFGEGDLLVIQSLGDQVAIAIENACLYDRSRELAVLEERNRLARELHDSITQSLFSLDLHARAITTYLKRNPQQAEAQVQELRQITHDTLQEMHSLIFDLHPFSLEEIGLVPALRQQIERLRRPDGPEIVLHATGERRLSAEVEQGLFRIAQEALRNAVKHSGARLISVALTTEPERATLCVTDDGRGFDPQSRRFDRRAFGLVGMRERAELLDGDFEIVSQPGAGTQVKVQVLA